MQEKSQRKRDNFKQNSPPFLGLERKTTRNTTIWRVPLVWHMPHDWPEPLTYDLAILSNYLFQFSLQRKTFPHACLRAGMWRCSSPCAWLGAVRRAYDKEGFWLPETSSAVSFVSACLVNHPQVARFTLPLQGFRASGRGREVGAAKRRTIMMENATSSHHANWPDIDRNAGSHKWVARLYLSISLCLSIMRRKWTRAKTTRQRGLRCHCFLKGPDCIWLCPVVWAWKLPTTR